MTCNVVQTGKAISKPTDLVPTSNNVDTRSKQLVNRPTLLDGLVTCYRMPTASHRSWLDDHATCALFSSVPCSQVQRWPPAEPATCLPLLCGPPVSKRQHCRMSSSFHLLPLAQLSPKRHGKQLLDVRVIPRAQSGKKVVADLILCIKHIIL